MGGQQHEHSRSRLAGLEQPFAVLVMAWLAEPAHARDLVRGQYGEGLLMARKHRCNGSPPLQIVVHRGIYAHPSLTSSEKTHPIAGTETAASFAAVFSPFVIWRSPIPIGTRRCQLPPRPRLRFSPLEIRAQRQLQPSLFRILG